MADRLNGHRILILETREEAQFARLLAEHGAEVMACPMFVIHDAPDPAPVAAWIDRFIASPPDDLLLMTGEGLRRLLKLSRSIGTDADFIGALSQPRKFARGPKPVRALREIGLEAQIVVQPPTTDGIMQTLAGLDLQGRRLGLQLYPDRDPSALAYVVRAKVPLIQIGIAIAITLPLGIGTAVFMSEVGGRFSRVVRTVVEAMTALPSIVAGLFIYSVFIVAIGLPRSGLAAALAIGVMMLPIIARAADVVLRVVPGGLREASLALGASRWRTVWYVVLPTARPGLATACILGIARGIGETSPVLLTSGNAQFFVVDPTDGVMNSLPLFIYSTVRSGEPNAIARAFAAATVLLAVVLALFVLARLIARPKRTKSRRGRSRPAVDFVHSDPLVEMGPVAPAIDTTYTSHRIDQETS